MSTVLRLEKDGKKYWIASVDGKTAIVTFGKIGKEDKEESKKFDEPGILVRLSASLPPVHDSAVEIVMFFIK